MSYTCYPCGAAVSDEEHSTVQALFDAIDLLDLHWEFGEDSDGRIETLTNDLGLYHCVGKPENFDSTSSVVVCQECLDKALVETGVLDELDYPNTPKLLLDHKVALTGVDKRCAQCKQLVRVVASLPFRICSDCFAKNEAEISSTEITLIPYKSSDYPDPWWWSKTPETL